MDENLIPRVVKQHHIFKGKRGGETVMCEPAELEHASAKLATVSLEEHEASLAPAPAAAPEHDSVGMAKALTERLKHESVHREASEQRAADREAEQAAAKADKLRSERETKKASKADKSGK